MERIRMIKQSGKGCTIMIGGKKVVSNAEWSMEGITMMTWKQWIWFKIKQILHIKLNPTFHTGNAQKSGRGGYRPGSGRPVGSKDRHQRSKGKCGGYRPGSGPKKGTKYKPRMGAGRISTEPEAK